MTAMVDDVMALIAALRGMIQAAPAAPVDWRRFLAIHLAGLRTAG